MLLHFVAVVVVAAVVVALPWLAVLRDYSQEEIGDRRRTYIHI